MKKINEEKKKWDEIIKNRNLTIETPGNSELEDMLINNSVYS